MQQQPRIHKTATPPELRAVARHGQMRPSLAGIRRRVTDAALWVRCRYQLGRKVLLQAHKQDKASRATVSIKRSRPMAESEPGLVRELMLKANMHLDMLVRGALPKSDIETHDYLAHIIAISQIRVIQIGVANKANGMTEANDLMGCLNEAGKGLLRARQRHTKTGKWGLDGPAIEALRDAIGIYEEIMRASSSLQMEQAQDIRIQELQAMVKAGTWEIAA